jgi:hypothetical protein
MNGRRIINNMEMEKETFEEYLQRLKDRRTELNSKYTDEDFKNYIYHIFDCYEKNVSVYKCLEFMYFMEREPIQELGILEVPMPISKKETLPELVNIPMMVSMDGINWKRRNVIAISKGTFVTSNSIKTCVDTDEEFRSIDYWKLAKPIQL